MQRLLTWLHIWALFVLARLADLRDNLLANSPRMGGWWVIALVLGAIVWQIAPQQLPVAIYKLCLVAIAAVSGYWIDRCAFPYARPHRLLNDWAYAAAMLRRSLIMAAAMIAVSIGV
jgi:hypothetical protein